MSLSSTLENAVQALATWLLETPVVSQTVRLRIEAAHWRSGMLPRPVPEAPPKKSETHIVIGVRPGGFIFEGLARAHNAKRAAEGRAD
jgi:hypothetical protein